MAATKIPPYVTNTGDNLSLPLDYPVTDEANLGLRLTGASKLKNATLNVSEYGISKFNMIRSRSPGRQIPGFQFWVSNASGSRNRTKQCSGNEGATNAVSTERELRAGWRHRGGLGHQL